MIVISRPAALFMYLRAVTDLIMRVGLTQGHIWDYV